MKTEQEYKKKQKNKRIKEEIITKPIVGLMIITALLILFNQVQVSSISTMMDHGNSYSNPKYKSISGEIDLSNLNLAELKSTGNTVAAVFPVKNIQSAEDAIAIMFPTGTPEYGTNLGISYDTPVESLAILSKMYRGLKSEVKQNNLEGWNRFMNLASRPVGISCEYCCGLKAVGIDKNGNSACGCQHNPALLSVALYLSAYSDYNDGEILREVMKWKTLFFPKNMIELGMSVAGEDSSSLNDLPGMVGGC